MSPSPSPARSTLDVALAVLTRHGFAVLVACYFLFRDYTERRDFLAGMKGAIEAQTKVLATLGGEVRANTDAIRVTWPNVRRPPAALALERRPPPEELSP